MAGNRRFGKLLQAAKAGKTSAPLDLRYLSRPKESVKEDETRADVVAFLFQLYHSCAETLPDVRDDPLSREEEIKLENSESKTELDPYAEKLSAVASAKACLPAHGSDQMPKRRKLRRGVRINELRTDEEIRYLPPGTMKDHWEQYKMASRCETKASFPTFWRDAWLSEDIFPKPIDLQTWQRLKLLIIIGWKIFETLWFLLVSLLPSAHYAPSM